MHRIFDLEEMLASERNRRQQPAISEFVAADIDEHIEQLESRLTMLWDQIDAWIAQHDDLRESIELLTSVPGVGREPAAKLV
jgi:hypothetical protein